MEQLFFPQVYHSNFCGYNRVGEGSYVPSSVFSYRKDEARSVPQLIIILGYTTLLTVDIIIQYEKKNKTLYYLCSSREYNCL